MMRHRTVYISGVERVVSYNMLRLLRGWTRLPEGYRCDGCSWSPDSWRGYKLWPACALHDLFYRDPVERGEHSRRQVDADFRYNLGQLLYAQRAPLHLCVGLPWVYWVAVKRYGAGSWHA